MLDQGQSGVSPADQCRVDPLQAPDPVQYLARHPVEPLVAVVGASPVADVTLPEVDRPRAGRPACPYPTGSSTRTTTACRTASSTLRTRTPEVGTRTLQPCTRTCAGSSTTGGMSGRWIRSTTSLRSIPPLRDRLTLGVRTSPRSTSE